MFKLEEFMGKRVLKSSLLNNINGDDKVIAFFTTRDLPLKTGERDDLIEEVENNKKLLCEGLNIPLDNLIIPIQTHSDNVAVVNGKQETGNGEQNLSTIRPFNHSTYENTDALITNQRGVCLALNFADCVPIIFYDPVKKVIAIAHAGWRGTVAKIGPKTVQKMVKNFGCKPKDIIALIGPAIEKCCFEAGEDVLQKLNQSTLPLTPTLSRKGRGGSALAYANFDCKAFSNNHADLKLINKIQLLATGVKKIDVCEYCTSCQSELFFSYRKEKGKTARHSAVIMVSGEQ